MEKLYIYGKLNKEEIIKQYTAGLGNGTANTIIDNQNNKISVEVIKTPHKLSIKDVEFDGSQDVIVDLSEYATNEQLSQLNNKVDTFDSKIDSINTIANTELFAYVDTDSTTAGKIVLKFKNKNNATLSTSVIEFPDQVQADWMQADSTKPSYIRNKPTRLSQFTNDGDGKGSPFITVADVDAKVDEKLKIIKTDGQGNKYLADDGKYKDIVTNRSLNPVWKIDGTTQEFINSILADSTAVVGTSYLGGVEFTDLPTPLNNAECLVEILSSTLGSDIKVIHLDLYSATTSPYHWSTIYYTQLPDPIWQPDVTQSNVDEKLDKNVLTEASFKYEGDNVYLDKSLTNIASDDRTNLSEQVQLASDSQAGLMSMADYQQIRKNTERIESLEGKTTRLLYTAKTDPTADDINAFVTGLGHAAPFEGIAVVVDKTFHIWHYYENDNIGWKDDGVDTVDQFTNTSLGTIKGAEIDGKVYAETDGTGSVYGWGALKGQITNVEQNLDSYVLKTTKVAGKPLNADVNLSTLRIKQGGADVGTYDGSEDFEINLPDESSADYQIVTEEPEDKSQGKMIYEKSSGVTLGKAVVDKTAGASQYYSNPSTLVDKIFGGTATPNDIETYEYLLFRDGDYVAGYINIGNLPELTQYAFTHDSIEVIFKVNNGAEQSDILSKNSDGNFGNSTNKFQTMKSQSLVEGAGSDYYTLDLQAGGVAQSFRVEETDTIQITRLKLGDVYIDIDKDGSEGPFAIANLKIANGTQYNPLKQLINAGMQEKLTAGTGITIENNIISATAQDIRTDNQTTMLNANQEIQTIGVYNTSTNNTLSANDLWLASSIKRRKK